MFLREAYLYIPFWVFSKSWYVGFFLIFVYVKLNVFFVFFLIYMFLMYYGLC